MTDTDHEELLQAILRSRAKIMVSGYESDMYSEYLREWHRRVLPAGGGWKSEQEIVWMNYECECTDDAGGLGGRS